MNLSFVILRHEGVPQPHYDLMFESGAGGALATWRSDIWPIDRPTAITRLADHRRAYLDYEGPVSNDRGHVRRVAAGQCQIDIATDGSWTIRIAQSVMFIRPTAGDKWLCGAGVSPAICPAQAGRPHHNKGWKAPADRRQ